jgi:polyisoprenoid-binding protein YceI
VAHATRLLEDGLVDDMTVKKIGLFTVPATLAGTSGTIEINDTHQVAEVEVAVNTSSYASKNAKRDEHVLGPDFLDTETHPTITFQTVSVTPGSDGYTSNGTVAVKDRKAS